jgi:histidinol-phosphate/aromatic aminotransferase/cobyric acid decarboxylase-like protein
MCELTCNTAKEVAQGLLFRYNILVKDLSSKKGVKGEYIRLAIRRPWENERLLLALNEVLYSNKEE